MLVLLPAPVSAVAPVLQIRFCSLVVRSAVDLLMLLLLLLLLLLFMLLLLLVLFLLLLFFLLLMLLLLLVLLLLILFFLLLNVIAPVSAVALLPNPPRDIPA